MSDDLKFNVSKIWKITSMEKDTLTLGIYNGNSNFTLWKTGDNKPALKFGLPVHVRIKLCMMLSEVMKASPNTRVSIVKSDYDPGTKVFTPDVTLVVGKDDKNLMYIEIGNKSVNPIRFYFRVSGTYSFSGPNGDMDKISMSALAAQGLKDVLEGQIPMGEVVSTFNMKPTAYTANKYGNSPGRPNTPNYGNDEDIPF